MKLSPSEDQTMLAESFRRLFAAESPIARAGCPISCSGAASGRSSKRPTIAPPARCPMFASEAFLADATGQFKLTAPLSLLRGKTMLGTIELAHRHSAGTTIYGGTSEAQRSLIADKALGLPRSR